MILQKRFCILQKIVAEIPYRVLQLQNTEIPYRVLQFAEIPLYRVFCKTGGERRQGMRLKAANTCQPPDSEKGNSTRFCKNDFFRRKEEK